jgi:hypothetical protein
LVKIILPKYDLENGAISPKNLFTKNIIFSVDGPKHLEIWTGQILRSPYRHLDEKGQLL